MSRNLGALLAAGLMLVALAAPTAGASHSLRAEFAGPTYPPIADPGTVAARCPAGSQWILAGYGDGAMTSPVYSGPFTYANDHCSRWQVSDPERMVGKSVGKAAAGVMTITVPGGDKLVVRYEGTWVFEGEPPTHWADVQMSYRLDGGTGVFDGARGSGRMFAAGGIDMSGVLKGSIRLPE